MTLYSESWASVCKREMATCSSDLLKRRKSTKPGALISSHPLLCTRHHILDTHTHRDGCAHRKHRGHFNIQSVLRTQGGREAERGEGSLLCILCIRGTPRGFSAGTHADACDAFSGLWFQLLVNRIQILWNKETHVFLAFQPPKKL